MELDGNSGVRRMCAVVCLIDRFSKIMRLWAVLEATERCLGSWLCFLIMEAFERCSVGNWQTLVCVCVLVQKSEKWKAERFDYTLRDSENVKGFFMYNIA